MPSRAKAALDATVRSAEDRCGIASDLGNIAGRKQAQLRDEATSPIPKEA